jgi:hypothetical protein
METRRALRAQIKDLQHAREQLVRERDEALKDAEGHLFNLTRQTQDAPGRPRADELQEMLRSARVTAETLTSENQRLRRQVKDLTAAAADGPQDEDLPPVPAPLRAVPSDLPPGLGISPYTAIQGYRDTTLLRLRRDLREAHSKITLLEQRLADYRLAEAARERQTGPGGFDTGQPPGPQTAPAPLFAKWGDRP